MPATPPARFPSRYRSLGCRLDFDWLEERLAPAAGDTLAEAVALPWRFGRSAMASGFLASSQDVQLFAVTLTAGDWATASVHAQSKGYGLDGLLRIFDQTGHEIARNDNWDGLDPGLAFQASKAGTYYLGISAADNTGYDPLAGQSGKGRTQGLFDLEARRSPGPLQPDLTGSEFRVDEGPVVWGENLTVHYQLENRGGAAATASLAEVRLSTDNRLGSDDFLLSTLTIPALAAGESVRGTLFLTLPARPSGFSASGAMYLGMRIDAAGSVSEHDESNNSGQRQGSDFTALRFLVPFRETEPNETIDTAPSLPLETRLSGSLDSSADSDLFRLTIPQQGNWSAQVQLSAGSPRLTLLNQDGQQLVTSDATSVADPSARIVQNMRPGVYYLQVSGTAGNLGSYGVDVTFTPGMVSPLRLNSSPRDIVIVDVNEDGLSDLVTANQVSNDVAVFLGFDQQQGEDFFANPMFFPAGLGPVKVRTGDVNGDGHVDLVTANLSSGDVAILLGNGNGTFATPRYARAQGGPVDLGLTDLDGDGVLDIATANRANDEVAVLLGRGDGSFQPASLLSVPSLPKAIKVVDVNDDGLMDILTSNESSNDVAILLGIGEGLFASPQRLDLTAPASSFDIGDVNGDGRLDLVATLPDALALYRGLSAGEFAAPETFPIRFPSGVSLADATGDGLLDILAISRGIVVLENDGNGAFQEIAELAGNGPGDVPFLGSTGQIMAVASGKWGQDSTPLIAMALDFSQVVLRFDPFGTRGAQRTLEVGQSRNPWDMAAVDLDRDNLPDLVTINQLTDALSIQKSNGDGSFQTPTSINVTKHPVALATADFNGDGLRDVVTAHQALTRKTFFANSVSLQLNRGDGRFGPPQEYTVSTAPSAVWPFYDTGSAPMAVAVADVNEDGFQDVLTVNQRSSNLAILFGLGNGSLTSPMFVELGFTPTSLTAGDVDDDGRVDVLVASAFVWFDVIQGGELHVLHGNGDGTFTSPQALPGSRGLFRSMLTDLNNDGLPECVTLGFDDVDTGTGMLSIYGGLSNGSPSASQAFKGIGLAQGLAAGDINLDGKRDLLVTDANAGQTYVFKGNGDGTVTDPKTFTTGGASLQVIALDVNEDSYPDVLSANLGTSTVDVLLGLGQGDFLETRSLPSYFTTIVGDVNGDGRMDLLSGGTNVSVSLGQGDGTFQPEVISKVGGFVGRIFVDDANGDGRADVLFEGSGNFGTGIMLGNGDGSFQPVQSLLPDNLSSLVAVMDVNPDGSKDVWSLLYNPIFEQIGYALLLSNGDGTFQTPEVFSELGEYSSSEFVPADMNRDGLMDVVAVSGKDEQLHVVLRTASGTFQVNQRISFLRPVGRSQNFAQGVHVADVNSDGYLDVVVGNSNAYDVSLFLGSETGQLGAEVRLGTGGDSMVLAVMDLTGDEIIDLLVNNFVTNDLSLLIGRDDGSFIKESRIIPPNGSLFSTPVDLNLDGLPDLIVHATDLLSRSVLLNQGGGLFLPIEQVVSNFDRAPALVDFNQDGTTDMLMVDRQGAILWRNGVPGQPGAFAAAVGVNPDRPARSIAVVGTASRPLVAAVDQVGDGITLYARQGTSFAIVRSLHAGSLPAQLVAADINGDGHTDLAVRNAGDGTVSLFEGNGAGDFTLFTTLPLGPAFAELRIADTDGDGRPELLAANQSVGDVAVYRNLGGFTFAAPIRYRAGNSLYDMQGGPDAVIPITSKEGTVAVLLGAFLGGNAHDLLTINPSSRTFGVLADLGNGRFANPQTFHAEAGLTAQPGDFDGDGFTDVAVLTATHVVVYRSNDIGGFLSPVSYLAGESPQGLTVADANLDGRLDLLIGNDFGDVLTLLGNGDATFQSFRQSGDGIALAVADLNGDGTDDFIFGNEGLDRVSLQLGDGTTKVFQDRGDGLLAPDAVKLADLNGDGQTDLIVANSGGNSVLTYLGLGDGSFGAKQEFFVGSNPVSLAIADVNGDGQSDILTANQGSNDVSILLGQSGIAWTLTTGPRLKAGLGPTAVALADITADGKADVLVSNGGANTILALPGIGGGFFNDNAPLSQVVGSNPVGLFVGDFDDLAGLDVVTLNATGPAITYVSNFGQAGASRREVSIGSQGATAGFSDDFNLDGFQDIVLSSNEGELALLLGNHDGLSLAASLHGVANPTDLALAGLGQGTMEVYVARAGQEAVDRLEIRYASAQVSQLTEVGTEPGTLVLVATLLNVPVSDVHGDQPETPLPEPTALAPFLPMIETPLAEEESAHGSDSSISAEETPPIPLREPEGMVELLLNVKEGFRHFMREAEQRRAVPPPEPPPPTEPPPEEVPALQYPLRAQRQEPWLPWLADLHEAPPTFLEETRLVHDAVVEITSETVPTVTTDESAFDTPWALLTLGFVSSAHLAERNSRRRKPCLESAAETEVRS